MAIKQLMMKVDIKYCSFGKEHNNAKVFGELIY